MSLFVILGIILPTVESGGPSSPVCQNFYSTICGSSSESDLAWAESDRVEIPKALNIQWAEKQTYLDQLLNLSKSLSTRQKSLRDTYASCLNESAAKTSEVKENKKLRDQILRFTEKKDLLDWVQKRSLSHNEGWLHWDAVRAFQDTPSHWRVDVRLPYSQLYSLFQKPEFASDLSALWKESFSSLSTFYLEERANAFFLLSKEIASYSEPTASTASASAPQLYSFVDFKKEYPLFALKDRDAPILISNPAVLKRLHQFVEQGSLLDIRDLYWILRILPRQSEGSPSIWKQKIKLEATYWGGPQEIPPRKEQCVRTTAFLLDREIDFEIFQKNISKIPSKEILEQITQLRSSLIRVFETSLWLSLKSVQTARRQLQSVQIYLFGPSLEKDWDFLPLKLSSSKDWRGILDQIDRARAKRLWATFSKKDSSEIWPISPLAGNASFDRRHSRIFLPLGIFREPLYREGETKEKFISSIGFLISHELFHSLEAVEWLTESEQSKLLHLSLPYLGEFERLGYRSANIRSEALADLSALEAVLGMSSGGKKSDRAFFRTFAEFWCPFENPKTNSALKQAMKHPIPQDRLQVLMKTQRRFNEAFGCSHRSLTLWK